MRRYLFLILILCGLNSFAAKVEVSNLTTENLINPLGIDTQTPRFSWKILSEQQQVIQESYRILVASSEVLLAQNKGDLWDSGETTSHQQLWIPYEGTRLKSGQRVWWKIQVKTNKGRTTWSEPQTFSVGLLNESDWQGRWIGLERLMPGEHSDKHSRLAARYLRKEFALKEGVSVMRATAYVAGLGYYEFYVNGTCLNPNTRLPMPTDYRKTILYNTYDVTSLLSSRNAVGMSLGNGYFYAIRQDKPYKNTQFGYPKCRVNIIVDYSDGTRETWKTDETWRVTANGPIRANNEYDGEEYDSRQELTGWTQVDYDDTAWQQAERSAIPTGTLRPQMAPPVTATESTLPSLRHITTHNANSVILDIGQNISGVVSFHPSGMAGDTIRLRFAERLLGDTALYTDNLRSARCEDIYVCNGKETDDTRWQPSFVTHGFRYVEVMGLKDIDAADFQVLTVNDEMALTGKIVTSDSTLNRIIENASWGIRSNYHGMPVDCPQRDERMPWLGDRTMGSLGESFLFNNERLYAKWMRDICDAQRSDGCIPDVAPAFWNYFSDNITWPAALPFTCEMLWRQFGNQQPMDESYPAIKKWIAHIIETYSDADGIITKDTYGDWCVPPERLELIHSEDPNRKTDGALISTAYVIHILQLLHDYAQQQGTSDEASRFEQQASQMTEAFNKRFLNGSIYDNNTATANLLPLAFDLVPDSCRDVVMKNLVNTIATKNDCHLSCGVIGISWLLRTLSDNGRSDLAWRLTTTKTYPSWGYMAEHGATTIWELWNGDTANPAMNSGNHVMLLGDLLTWCYQYLAGILQTDTAYHRIQLKPDFSIPDCFFVDASYNSPYGTIRSSWKKSGRKVNWLVEIPANTSAEVYLADGSMKEIGSGSYFFESEMPLRSGLLTDHEFIYDSAPFPSCHASTIVELQNGDLLAAWFGGKYEGHPDVKIWSSRKKKGSNEWSAPVVIADGTFQPESDLARIAGIEDEDKGRKACYNPVLYQMPDGEIWLFYKIGRFVQDWTGWYVRSSDNGFTWSQKEPLPEGFLGPVKNKPVLMGRRLLCPSSTEKGGWKIHFEVYDLDTHQWSRIGPIEAEQSEKTYQQGTLSPIGCIQPSILKLADGRLQVLCRSQNGRLATSFSSDKGLTWTPVSLTSLPNNNSGTDAVTLKDGRHLLVYNPTATQPGEHRAPRTPLCVAISDDGLSWRHLLTLEDSPISEYSYPAIIQGSNGDVYITYTWRRERIKFVRIKNI
ncbi:MAG: family 78 glycoside hydrolase catalytic domain [Prevotella sp.]|nr:family 78 glycoside hydrolase catalytic domain [Prevotella sp.]